MALETGTYINSLNASNPVSTDGLSQADDHLRLIKSTIKSTFPSIDGAVTSTEDDLNIVSGASAAGVTAAEFQYLNGVTSAIQTQLTNLMPSGAIILWSGATNAIPTGFVLCDGTNSTPDLRNRFVVGAGSTYAVGATGGADSVTLTSDQMPSHSHTATSTSTVTDPGHSHTYRIINPSGGDGSSTRYGNDATGTTSTATTGISVSTSTSIGNTGGGNSHENRPPYYALCYIMKT
jgi:microcystin-dependent protein